LGYGRGTLKKSAKVQAIHIKKFYQIRLTTNKAEIYADLTPSQEVSKSFLAAKKNSSQETKETP
jgi:hypothetical protein